MSLCIIYWKHSQFCQSRCGHCWGSYSLANSMIQVCESIGPCALIAPIRVRPKTYFHCPRDWRSMVGELENCLQHNLIEGLFKHILGYPDTKLEQEYPGLSLDILQRQIAKFFWSHPKTWYSHCSLVGQGHIFIVLEAEGVGCKNEMTVLNNLRLKHWKAYFIWLNFSSFNRMLKWWILFGLDIQLFC